MGLIKITFDGSTLSSKQDADIDHHVSGLVPAGIIRGLGSELSYSASNNYITFQDGYVQIYGRRIYVETGSRIYISLDSTRYGYVVITVNLTSNSVTLGIAENASAYPTLTQQDLSKTGIIYQFPICKYTKTTTALSIVSSFERTFIGPALPTAQQALAKANGISLKKYEINTKLYVPITYEAKNTVSFSIKEVPHNSVILLTFSTYDSWGYGGTIDVCGSIVYRRETLKIKTGLL